MSERPAATPRRSWSASISARPTMPKASTEAQQLAASAGVGALTVVRRPARSVPIRRSSPASGKVDEIARSRRGDRCAESSIFNHELVAGAGAQSREAPQLPRHRPHQPDPRHLRAARAQPRRQAAGRARAARASGDAPGARLDPPRAPERRYRPARARARRSSRPTAGLLGKRVKVLKEKLARMQAQRAVQRRARERRATCSRCRSSATPTPASRRCSTR